MKRIIAFVLALISTLCLFSCNGKEKPTSVDVMSYKGESISSGLYGFIFSYNKSSYLYLMQNYDGTANAEDTESFWNTVTADGLTLGEGVVKDINDHCKMILIASSMAEEYGVSLTEDNISAAESELNDLIAAFGSEKRLNTYLGKFALDADDVLEYLKKKHLVVALQNKLCADGGICSVDDEELIKYTGANYIKVKHIYYSNEKHDDKAYEELLKLCEDVKNGTTKFDDLKSKSEDNFLSSNPKGAMAEKSSLNDDYLKCAESLKNGEHSVVKIEQGAYLIERVAITDDDIEENFEAVYSKITDEKFSSLISSYYNSVEINSGEINKYDIITAESYKFA